MRAIERTICRAVLILVMLGTIAFAQDLGPDPGGESNGDFFVSENPQDVEDILDQLVAPAEESVQTLQELLHPANTNSPRDTIISFLKLTQRYYVLLRQDAYTPEDAAELQHLYDEMQWFFDLRNVAPSLRQDVAVNSAVYLREIIDRIGLPPLEQIPDREQMLAAVQDGYPSTWKIGSSPLEIVRIDEGPNQGKYLFSEETLETVEDLFWQVRSFPYRTTSAEGFYQASFLTPNPTLQSWTDGFPAWMHNDILGQTIWQWIAMVSLFALAILSIWLLSSILRRLTRSVTPLARSATLLLVPLFAALVSYALYDLIGDKIFITGMVFQTAVYVIYGMALIAAIIFIFSLGTVMIDLAAATEYAKRRPSDIHLVALGIRVVSIIAIIAVLLQGMRLMGFSLATILASAGVTGLAVALAAQNTLRNVFGSLMLLLDKPFEVGQRIKIRGYEGTVEDIGMRSTRLRLLTGHLVSIPNENVAEMDIENVDERPSIRRTFNLSMAYDTSLEKIQRAVAILREVLSVPVDAGGGEAGAQPSRQRSQSGQEVEERHPNEAINSPERPPRVFFNELTSGSLNITVTYWYSPPNYWAYLEHCQMINHEIIRRFREENIPIGNP
ncbi:mechanosensitive ion channel domain-containing protein [Chelativorans sp. AA-79]|uniref:mechanosensitive ion channel family protein n=1 Tax=Chelativorans sp. AA-79 TaxID=3028735 RepID=UPI0023F83379|nr:mechanosensitive ion channel domain-containing protein [Chelativorans sp. AA-79]WEX11146.1 mechanosensitive ion channel [Chelativorans sp. AA-79]